MNKIIISAFTFFLLCSCSSSIDPDLLAQIENRTALTENLFDKYEDLNEELMEVIEEQNYAYKKMIKAKNALRVVNNRINSRQKRISMIQNPPKPKEGEEGKAVQTENPAVLEGHQDKLAEYTEEQAELQTEVDEWLALTREHTARELELRTARNAAYDEYTKSRQALKELNKKAESK